jgi:hypothetical protein
VTGNGRRQIIQRGTLAKPTVKLAGPTDPRFPSTLDRVTAERTSDSLVYRYAVTGHDGLYSEEIGEALGNFPQAFTPGPDQRGDESGPNARSIATPMSSWSVTDRPTHLAGSGWNSCPSAWDNPTNTRVAGDEHGMSCGVSVSVGDSAHAPDGMSLLTNTTTEVSVRVS